MLKWLFVLSRSRRKIHRVTKTFRQERNDQSSYAPKIQNQASERKTHEFIKARVRQVIDGDTAIVTIGRSEIVVRLDSIDCPEDGQYWGDIAKYGLIKIVGGQNVRLEEHGKDSYGRTLATMYVWSEEKNEWLNVNERMVTLGHAWVMRRFYDHLTEDRKERLNRLERWAKSKKVGLWHQNEPTPPWKWRNRE
ncbi:MAG: thermonuclease family protein [Alphaproteobacteria bacterium]|nr:thermonuclease family protein [Alphaproteobacteria bacterium]